MDEEYISLGCRGVPTFITQGCQNHNLNFYFTFPASYQKTLNIEPWKRPMVQFTRNILNFAHNFIKYLLPQRWRIFQKHILQFVSLRNLSLVFRYSVFDRRG